MRGDTIFQIFGVHEGREKDVYLGAFKTREETQNEVEKLKSRLMNGENWAQNYHNRGFEILATVVTTEFEIPLLPKPRDNYFVICTDKPNQPGTWNSTHVEVFKRGLAETDNRRICEYQRNYDMLDTFEPFRQGN